MPEGNCFAEYETGETVFGKTAALLGEKPGAFGTKLFRYSLRIGAIALKRRIIKS